MDKLKFLGKLAKEIRFNPDFIIGDKVWAVTEEGDMVRGTIVKVTYEPFKYGIEERINSNLPVVKIKKTTTVKVGQVELNIEQFFTDFGKGTKEFVLTRIEDNLPGAIFKTLAEADEYIKEQEKFKADILEAELAEDEEMEEDEDQED